MREVLERHNLQSKNLEKLDQPSLELQVSLPLCLNYHFQIILKYMHFGQEALKYYINGRTRALYLLHTIRLHFSDTELILKSIHTN